MARRRGRGGYQAPSKPAAVSGPGSLSARTDGGPGQPLRAATGGDYGDRKATLDQQRGAPLATAGGGGAAPAPGGPPPDPNGIFGPTTRPGEPLTAGIDWGAGPGAPVVPQFADDVNLVVRAIAAENPHLADYLLALADN